MLRRTKIVATLGPATNTPEMLDAIIEAGVDVVRLNFSHGSPDDHRKAASLIRERAAKAGRPVAILSDLQGPKLRIARFKDGPIFLEEGAPFALDATLDKDAGDLRQVGLDYEQLSEDVSPGDVLVLDDGRIEAEVLSVEGLRIETRVLIGGKLSNNKGLNKRGGGLSAPALTAKDRADLKTAVSLETDFLAVSFVSSASDMLEARALLEAEGSQAHLVAKIERADLVHDHEALDEVIQASDVIMVARGDLAVEIGDAELVGVQKYLTERARTLNRVVITATQMMESMISSPMPTRAEVSDIGNAAFDYTDAVMLSAESAIGEYPAEAVAAMARICVGAEKHPSTHQSGHRIHEGMHYVDEAIALSAMYAANHLEGVKAICCMTESGATPLMMSRIKSPLPIFAFCRRTLTQHLVCLYKGVQSISFDADKYPPVEVNQAVIGELIKRNIVTEGDRVIITKGDYINAQGGTNTMKIVRVGSPVL